MCMLDTTTGPGRVSLSKKPLSIFLPGSVEGSEVENPNTDEMGEETRAWNTIRFQHAMRKTYYCITVPDQIYKLNYVFYQSRHLLILFQRAHWDFMGVMYVGVKWWKNKEYII